MSAITDESGSDLLDESGSDLLDESTGWPTTGTTDWATSLNAYLAGLQAEADTNGVNFADHISAAPAGTPLTDPHGDRAYALSLMAPIQANVNKILGFIKLDAFGILPGDTWHDLRPVSASFEPPQDYYPPQFRRTLDGRILLAGYIVLTSRDYNGVQIFPGVLPDDCRPNLHVYLPVTCSNGGAGSLIIAPDGSCQFDGLDDGLEAGTLIGIYGSYPLDAYEILR